MPPEGEMTEEMRKKMIDARLYASIVESSNDAIISKTLDGIIQSWNVAAQRLFGYSAEQAIGCHVSMLIPADRTDEESLIITRLRAGERIEHYDTVRLRSDGLEVPVSLTISPVKDENGQIVMASKIVRDIPERRDAEVALRRSEKNLADFFDNATVCIHWVGPDGIILRANNAELELLGYSSQDYVGRHIADFHADQPVIDAILNCLARGDTLHDHAARLRCKNGSIREVLINSSVLREDGKFVHTRCVTRDVTTQRRAEAEARESEHRMRLATEATSVGIWEWNVITDEIRWDAMMFQIYGIDPTPNGAIQYTDWTQRVVAQDLPQQLSILNDTIHRIGSSKRQFRIRRGNDGELRDLECVETVRANDAGVAEWVVGTNLDVTQRKKAEEELRQSLEKVQALMDTLPVGVFVAHDPECRTITGNAAAHALLRTPNANLSKTGPADTAPMHFRVCRNDVDIPTEDLPVQRAARGEFLRDEEVDDVFDDGTVVHTLMSASPLYDGDGRVRGAVATVLDVTERKRAEKALARIAAESERQQRLYETVLTNTPDFMYVFSLDHRVIYANEALIAMWGKGRDGAIGKTFLEIGYEPWHAEMHAREIDEVRATKQPIRGQVPFDGAHGRRQYEYIFVPVIGADGEVEAVAGTTRDITDREQDEKKLRELAAELSESSHRKDEFLAMLAHELRNPLAPIRNGLQLIKLAGGQDAAIDNARAMMERQLSQMVRLVDDLMDVNRISRGKLELRKQPVSLAAVLNSAVEASRPLIDEMGHSLTLKLPDKSVIVVGDMTRLSQVFMNLLNNAAKYSDPNGRIELAFEPLDNHAVVTVSDTGIGIAPEQMTRIFEMFAQFDGSLEKSQGGLGIGLSLVKRLVNMHGGSVEAKSDGPGMGSKFIVRLPVFIGGSEASVPVSRHDDAALNTSTLRILVVDDNTDGADSLSEMLTLMGNDTRTAYDGQQAVYAAEDYRPDVILLDIGLPKLNGYEACRHIRAQPWGRNVVLIAVTGWGQLKDRDRTREVGFDHHLVKPVDPEALMTLLAELPIIR